MPIAAFRHNNPFDVSLPIAGWGGGGNIVGIKGQSGFANFPDMDTGYSAGVHRLNTYISGQSSHGAKRTIGELNSVYATDPNWANGVARHSGLGVNDALDVNDPAQMSKLQYGVLAQELGPENAAAVFRQKHGAEALSAINSAAGVKLAASPGALTTAFAPTEKTSMPALSADSTLGPGALNPEAQKGLFGLNVGDNTYDGLMGIASSLAGISNPDQAKALIAQQASMKKTPADQGTWSIHTFPNGQSVLMNSKGRMMPLQGNYAKPEKDTYTTEAEKASAKANQEYGDGIASAAANAGGLAGDVSELRRVFSNPGVYQGTGGDWVQSARKLYASVTGDTEGASTIADGDLAKALSNKLALKLVQDTGNGKLLPGSFSDSDRKFVQQMATSLENSPGANQRLLDIYERTIARSQQADAARQSHLDTNGGIYRPTIRGEIGKLQKQWADEDMSRPEPKTEPVAAKPASTGALPKGVKSIRVLPQH